MEEEKIEEKQEEVKEEIPEPDDKIDRANAAAQRTEEATKKLKEENDRSVALIVEKKLGGEAEAGKPTEKKEESAGDYAKKVMENDTE